MTNMFDFLEDLIGTRYVWWTSDMKDCGKMAYAENGKVPDVDTIRNTGINCVGVINLAVRFIGERPIPGLSEGAEYAGGTYVWFEYLNDNKVLQKFDYTKQYPAGTMLLRKYKDEEDQGHVAIVHRQEGSLLHAYPPGGLTLDDCIGTSHFGWGDGCYYTHACLPDDWIHRACNSGGSSRSCRYNTPLAVYNAVLSSSKCGRPEGRIGV